jgi:uncharacterized protein YegL
MTSCPVCDGSGAPDGGGCPVCGAGAPAAPPSPSASEESAPDAASPPEPDLFIAAGASEAPIADGIVEEPDVEEPQIEEPEPEPEEPPPPPHAVLEVNARYEFASVPEDDAPLTGILVEVEANGTPLREDAQGPVAHVIVALDLSASMNHPDKYPVLRDAVERMLADLRSAQFADVLISLVAFSRGAAVLLRSTSAKRIRPERLFDAIERSRLCFGNYTDIAGALSRAGRIAYEECKRNRTLPVRVYLLTDGRPQDIQGARDAAALLAKVPCDVHALAFGSDADVGILQDLFAGRRGGTVKSVRKETIRSAFERVAEVAQRVVATRCLVELDLAPGVVGGDVFRYRPARVRFPDPAFVDGKRFRADLGTIETGRMYSLLFELRPPEREEEQTHLGDVVVRIPGFGGPIETRYPLRLRRTPPRTDTGSVDPMVRTARDILDALTDEDPEVALRALRLRRKIYDQERRDPALLRLLDRSIRMLEKTGSLDGLTRGEFATLRAHTCTSSEEAALEASSR